MGFPDVSLLGVKFGVFLPQIRIPCKKLYIWSNVGQTWSKSRQINKNTLNMFINLNLGLKSVLLLRELF